MYWPHCAEPWRRICRAERICSPRNCDSLREHWAASLAASTLMTFSMLFFGTFASENESVDNSGDWSDFTPLRAATAVHEFSTAVWIVSANDRLGSLTAPRPVQMFHVKHLSKSNDF